MLVERPVAHNIMSGVHGKSAQAAAQPASATSQAADRPSGKLLTNNNKTYKGDQSRTISIKASVSSRLLPAKAQAKEFKLRVDEIFLLGSGAEDNVYGPNVFRVSLSLPQS